VTVEAVMDVMQRNVASAQATIRDAVPHLDGTRSCGCGRALENAIMTAPDAIPAETRARLGLLLDKYLGEPAG
jgi:5'-methylthioadenosine phosphorylase